MIDAYLARIGYDGPREPSLETLRAVHERHMLSVPYENLDIHAGIEIVAEERPMLEKIVVRRRGGMCYELNGAFAALLRGLGFDVTMLSARGWREEGGYGPDFDHIALLVRIDGSRWLADAGFGDSFVFPLNLDEEREQRDCAGAYRLRRVDDREWEMNVLHREERGYRFTLDPHLLSDFAPMCSFYQTSPESTLTQTRFCTMATRTGRITLCDDRLIVTENGVRREEPVDDEEAWRDALRAHFGITSS